MKKTLIIALAAALLLVGCSGEDDSRSYLYAAQPDSGTALGERPDSSTAASTIHAIPNITADEDGVIEIREKLFIAQTNDIYLNGGDYLGKTLRYQGLYVDTADWDDMTDELYHYVIRYGPGCCGYDGEAGFEVRWDGEWPQPNDWVEVEGVLCEEVFASGMRLLYIQVDSLTVMEERGAETVTT